MKRPAVTLWSKAHILCSEENSLGAYFSLSLAPILKIISLASLEEKEAESDRGDK